MASHGAADLELVDLLDCPVCLNFMYPPIYQCPNGHILCSNCKRNVNNRCPSCRRAVGNIRSLILEKMAESLEFPCRYQEEGCYGSFRYDLKEEHEESCRHRPYACPFPCSPPCMLHGDVKRLVTHLRADHQSDVIYGGKINTLFVVGPDHGQRISVKATVYHNRSEHFCLQLVATRPPLMDIICIYLTFMGSEVDARKFLYRIEIGNDERKITWKGIPRSIWEDAEKIRESYDGLIVHRSTVQSFAEIRNPNQLGLRVKGFIWNKRSRHPSEHIGHAASVEEDVGDYLCSPMSKCGSDDFSQPIPLPPGLTFRSRFKPANHVS